MKTILFLITPLILSSLVFSSKDFSFNLKDDRLNSTYEVSQLTLSNTWASDGKTVCNESHNQRYSQICSDGEGGAIIIWEDYRSGSNYDIYAQSVNSSGDLNWINNGIAISEVSENQGAPQICSDGAGGAIITWNDYRSGTNYDIYAQCVDSYGNIKWTVNGTPISITKGNQQVPQICSDGSGGAIITWTDSNRTNPDYDIYAQRINSTGDIKWGIKDIAICNSSDSQWFPNICNDEFGGAIITWEDYRNGHSDIYAQKVNATGNTQWTLNGTTICSSIGEQIKPQICSDGTDGAIIVWFDYRSISHSDIYAQFTKFALEPPLNGGKTRKFIPFGNYYLIFCVISIISLIIIYKRQIFTSSNYK